MILPAIFDKLVRSKINYNQECLLAQFRSESCMQSTSDIEQLQILHLDGSMSCIKKVYTY